MGHCEIIWNGTVWKKIQSYHIKISQILFQKKKCEGIICSDAWLFCIYNQIYAISAYVCELADSIQFIFYQFRWTVMSHCQTITGGLDTEVSGFNAQVKINMFWTLTLWICAAPKYWYPLEICFSKDGTLLRKAYMSISPRSNSGIKAMSQSLWLVQPFGSTVLWAIPSVPRFGCKCIIH